MIASILFYLLLFGGFVVGMFFARVCVSLAEYLGLLITTSLFNMTFATGLAVGMFYYWSAHKVDEVNLEKQLD